MRSHTVTTGIEGCATCRIDDWEVPWSRFFASCSSACAHAVLLGEAGDSLLSEDCLEMGAVGVRGREIWSGGEMAMEEEIEVRESSVCASAWPLDSSGSTISDSCLLCKPESRIEEVQEVAGGLIMRRGKDETSLNGGSIDPTDTAKSNKAFFRKRRKIKECDEKDSEVKS